jgi:bacterioferritin-associated ferredoxin
MAVDRCVCRAVSFEELWRLAQEVGPDLSKLQERTGCGTGCGLCVPYILEMLRTGVRDLPVRATPPGSIRL